LDHVALATVSTATAVYYCTEQAARLCELAREYTVCPVKHTCMHAVKHEKFKMMLSAVELLTCASGISVSTASSSKDLRGLAAAISLRSCGALPEGSAASTYSKFAYETCSV
jgi:hypothetical protein